LICDPWRPKAVVIAMDVLCGSWPWFTSLSDALVKQAEVIFWWKLGTSDPRHTRQLPELAGI